MTALFLEYETRKERAKNIPVGSVWTANSSNGKFCTNIPFIIVKVDNNDIKYVYLDESIRRYSTFTVSVDRWAHHNPTPIMNPELELTSSLHLTTYQYISETQLTR